jgi:hypothetical protein
MSNEYLRAAEDAKGLLAKFETVKKVAEAFALVGSLQQAQAEAEAALPKVQAELALARNAVANEQVVLDMIRADAKKITADAKTVADGIVASAQAKADALAAESNAKAAAHNEAVLGRQALAEAEAETVKAQRATLLKEVEDLEARADKARKYLAKLAV